MHTPRFGGFSRRSERSTESNADFALLVTECFAQLILRVCFIFNYFYTNVDNRAVIHRDGIA